MPYLEERLRLHNFIFALNHSIINKKTITIIKTPRIERPITSFQFQKKTVSVLQLVDMNKTRHNSNFALLRNNFVFEIIVL